MTLLNKVKDTFNIERKITLEELLHGETKKPKNTAVLSSLSCFTGFGLFAQIQNYEPNPSLDLQNILNQQKMQQIEVQNSLLNNQMNLIQNQINNIQATVDKNPFVGGKIGEIIEYYKNKPKTYPVPGTTDTDKTKFIGGEVGKLLKGNENWLDTLILDELRKTFYSIQVALNEFIKSMILSMVDVVQIITLMYVIWSIFIMMIDSSNQIARDKCFKSFLICMFVMIFMELIKVGVNHAFVVAPFTP